MYSVKVGEHGFLAREGTCDEGVLREVVEGDVYGVRGLDLGTTTPVVVDVGGHIGAFTRLAAGLWTQGRFFCFEANPMNYDIIGRNLESITSEKHLFRGALLGKLPESGKQKMVIARNEASSITGGWGFVGEDAEINQATTASVSVTAFWTLPDIMEQYGIERVNLLKLDCEGSEFSIVGHMPDEVLAKVDVLVAEIHCGALPHSPVSWDDFRSKILEHFDCPALEARPVVEPNDLFNIRATRKVK